jgi:hypothetical protein
MRGSGSVADFASDSYIGLTASSEPASSEARFWGEKEVARDVAARPRFGVPRGADPV